MNSYIIFIKDDRSEVVPAGLVSRKLSKGMKSKGFTRYPYKIEAVNEKEAMQKMNQQASEHLDELGQFSGSLFFYCAMLVVGLVVAFLLYR